MKRRAIAAAVTTKIAAGMGALLAGTTLALVAMAAPPARNTTPPPVQGRWIATTTSATNYWNTDGRYLGNGSGTAQLYEFDNQGHYHYYLLMEVRTGTFVTRANNDYQGTVTFDGDTFSLHPTSGHYRTETNGRPSEHDATSADLARVTRTYHWRMEKGADGQPRFIVPFEDGSKYEFKPAKPAPTNDK